MTENQLQHKAFNVSSNLVNKKLDELNNYIRAASQEE